MIMASKQPVTVESSPARYNRAVARGRAALVKAEAAQGSAAWVIGDLALQLETVYASGTVKQFAADLDLPPGTVYDFRKVAGAYAPDARGIASWTVHQILKDQDDRAELVQQAMTTAEARALVRSRNGEDADGEDDGDSDADGAGSEPDDLPAQLARAQAHVQQLRGQLEAAEAKVARIEAEIAAAAKPRRRGGRKLAAVA
jgi:hypothetical protein